MLQPKITIYVAQQDLDRFLEGDCDVSWSTDQSVASTTAPAVQVLVDSLHYKELVLAQTLPSNVEPKLPF